MGLKRSKNRSPQTTGSVRKNMGEIVGTTENAEIMIYAFWTKKIVIPFELCWLLRVSVPK
jgi:hypothetical protein